MPGSEYWKKRMEAIEKKSHSKGLEYAQFAEKQFYRAQKIIEKEIAWWYARIAENNEISYSAARELLRKDELEEFHWSVEEYIKKGERSNYTDQWKAQLENASAKVHIKRLEAMKLQMQQECEVLYGNLHDGLDEKLKEIYTDGYYRTAYEIQKGTGVGYAFNRLDNRKIEEAVNTAWAQDGKNFSDRLWQEKDKLVRELNAELTQSIIMGGDCSKAIEKLAKRLNVSKYNVGRLVMTETAAIHARSQKKCYEELAVEEFEFLATLDNKTSAICQEMDGKHFPMSQYEIGVTAPPLHPWCRSCTVPYFEDDKALSKRAARGAGGKTYLVPADMTYEEWKECFVKGGSEESFKELSHKNASVKNVEEAVENIGKSSKIKLNLQHFAQMPEGKFTDYALNPLKSPDKAKAFKEALGYDLENYYELMKNIEEHIDESKFVEKGDSGHGMRYEYIMELTGANGKKANVLTAWIQDGKEKRMTSVYVTKKKVTE